MLTIKILINLSIKRSIDMEISLKNLKLIMNNSYNGVYIVDKNRKIIYGNKAAENLTGYNNLHLIGNYCYDKILNNTDSHGVKLCKSACPVVRAIKYDEINEV